MLTVSASFVLVSAALPLLSWLMASLCSCIVNGFVGSWCCSYLSSCSCLCVFAVDVFRTHPQHPVGRICCCRLCRACACYEDFLASSVDGRRVFESMEVAQDACEFVSSLSSFLKVSIFFSIILLVFFCLSSFGVVLRFCMNCRGCSL